MKSDYSTDAIDTNNSRRNRDAAILKYVLGSTGDGVWEWNIESNQIYINKNFFEMLGYNHKKVSVSSNNLSRLIHPEDLFGFVNQFKKHFEDDIECVDYEIRIKSKNGQWVWFRIRGIAVEKNKITGEILKMVGIYIDRREKRQLVNELDEKNAMEKIERVLLNILSNAIKFTESGGQIFVDFNAEEDRATISIKDTGIGIPEDKIEKIFGRFKNEGTEFIIRMPNKTIVSAGVIKNEVAATKEVNVERLNIEFSDIYS